MMILTTTTTTTAATLFALLPLLASPATAIPAPATLVKRQSSTYQPQGPTNPYQLHPNGNNQYCLVVKGTPANGVPVTVDLCSSSSYNTFELPIYANEANLRLSGTQFCVDAGVGPFSGGPAKLWQCYNNLEQQVWAYNTDNSISLYQGTSGQCLDLKDGALPGSLQTWKCSAGNTNQKFTRTSALTPTTSTTSIAPPPTGTPPATGGQRIHPNGDTSKCLTVTPSTITDGSNVGVSDCADSNGRFSYYKQQLWDVKRGTTSVKLSGTNYCLDFGTSPNSNGVRAKVWTCYPGVTQQTFYYTDDNRIAIQGGTTCLDKTANAQQQTDSLFNYFPTQSWQCGPGNTNQVWTL